MYETQKKEKALLVLVRVEKEHDSWPVEEKAQEFKNLVLSTGLFVAGLVAVNRKTISPALYIGKGKAYELVEMIQEHHADVVIFNNNLNFTQQRNLEDIFGTKTIDRTQLILDIFSRHAHTQEGALQVELAQLEYLLPRLKGKGIMLSRLGGGIGTRGPGEKKLEVERRRIADRIVKLKKDLEEVRRNRQIQRKKRSSEGVSACSLLGYTNAGKSTLLNTVSDERQKTADSLFTTLDPVSRMVALKGHLKIVVSDTVGFIYKLPPHLIEAFKATLEELQYADVLLHIVDASSANYKRLIEAVNEIIKELHLDEKPCILVFNKIDIVSAEMHQRLKALHPDAVFISALKNINIDSLLAAIRLRLERDTQQLILKIPFSAMEVIDYLYKNSEVLKIEYRPEEIVAWVRIKASRVPALHKKPITVKVI